MVSTRVVSTRGRRSLVALRLGAAAVLAVWALAGCATAELEQLRTQTETLNDELTQSRAELDEERANANALRQEVEQTQATTDELTAEVEALSAERDRLTAEVVQAIRDRDAIAAQMADRDATIAEQTRRIEDLNDRIDDLEDLLIDIEMMSRLMPESPEAYARSKYDDSAVAGEQPPTDETQTTPDASEPPETSRGQSPAATEFAEVDDVAIQVRGGRDEPQTGYGVDVFSEYDPQSGETHFFDGSTNYRLERAIYLTAIVDGDGTPSLYLEIRHTYSLSIDPLNLQRVLLEVDGDEAVDLGAPDSIRRYFDADRRTEILSIHVDGPLLATIAAVIGSEGTTATVRGVTGEIVRSISDQEKVSLVNMLYAFEDLGGSLGP